MTCEISVVVTPQEVDVTVSPQTVSVEIADPSKVGPTGATIVSAEINNDSVLDFLMSDGRHVVVDNWYNSADSVEQVFTAYSSLLSSRVVKYDGTNISYASNDNSDDAYVVVGVTRQAGTEVAVVRDGVFIDNTFTFSAGDPIFLGTNGGLTQSAPTTGFLLQVGVAITSTKMLVSIDDPIFL